MVTIACAKKNLQQNLSETSGLFDDYLADRDILSACQAQNLSWRERFWTPLRTFQTFLAQVLDANGSCRQAVARAIVREAACAKMREIVYARASIAVCGLNFWLLRRMKVAESVQLSLRVQILGYIQRLVDFSVCNQAA
jgi:hypothetical protein